MTIYFAKAGETNFVKIGYAVDLARRVPTLQVGCPYRLEVIRSLPGGLRTEAWLHEHFAKRRVRAEWFTFCEEMLTVEPPHPGTLSKAQATRVYSRDQLPTDGSLRKILYDTRTDVEFYARLVGNELEMFARSFRTGERWNLGKPFKL